MFEVLVIDDDAGAELVAAIELVSPRNQDRPQSRHDFVVKCASLLICGRKLSSYAVKYAGSFPALHLMLQPMLGV